jgi:copper resistance protein C
VPTARRPLGRTLASVLLALALLLAGGPARAHTPLAGSTPEEGAVLAAAPAEVELEFTQAVGRDFARAQVSVDGADAQEVAPVVDGAVVSVPLAASGAGRYRVDVRVVGADGHPVEASLTFTVDPSAEPTGADPDPADPDGGDPADPGAATPAEVAEPPSAADPGSPEDPAAQQDPASQESDDGPGLPWLLLLALGAVLAVGGAAAGAARQRAAARERQDGR